MESRNEVGTGLSLSWVRHLTWPSAQQMHKGELCILGNAVLSNFFQEEGEPGFAAFQELNYKRVLAKVNATPTHGS